MSFAVLPAELQLRIITDCIEAQQISSTVYIPRPDDLSVQQATSLALVSRSFHAIVGSILFRHVRVTRPSSLLDLHAIFKARPQLGQLVAKLHIGPENELEGKAWPLEDGGEQFNGRDFRLKTSLGPDEEEKLPRWCEPNHLFNINRPAGGCHQIVISKAIRAALTDLDVQPWRRGYSESGQRIGVRKWAARLFLVQAALDLFLIEMRRIEDVRSYKVESWRNPDLSIRHGWSTDACAASKCGHYPALKIVPTSTKFTPLTRARGSRQELFVISETQLWQHVLRRKGSADHFDHLIRFTNSTPRGLGMAGSDNEWRRVRLALGGPPKAGFSEAQWHFWWASQGPHPIQPHYDGANDTEVDRFPHWIDEHSDDEDGTTSAGPQAQTHDALQGHRVEDMLHACCSILAATPNVLSLSLTGCSHRALPSLCVPEALHSLLIGPRFRYWDRVLPNLSLLRFDNLVRLRVVSLMTRQDIDEIVGGVPKVRDVQWELPDKAVSLQSLCNILRLQGYFPPSRPEQRASQALSSRKRPRENSEDETAFNSATRTPVTTQVTPLILPSPSPTRFPTPLTRRILVLLHFDVVAEILRPTAHQTESICKAWEQGSRLVGAKHLVLIKDSQALRPRSDHTLLVVWQRPDLAALSAIGQHWWENA